MTRESSTEYSVQFVRIRSISNKIFLVLYRRSETYGVEYGVWSDLEVWGLGWLDDADADAHAGYWL